MHILSINLKYIIRQFYLRLSMETYIAILRGINVSGQKMIKMDALRKMCGALKFHNAQTYIQSGNIIFQFKESDPSDLEKKISKAIKKEFGFDVPVIVKGISELKFILKENPFLIKRKEDITKLHVTFLGAEPDKSLLANIAVLKYGDDAFFVVGKSVYLFCQNGYGKTKLSNNYFESRLKTSATTRNWKTLNELLQMAENNSFV